MNICRITAYLHRNLSKEVLDSLKERGVRDLYLRSARSLVIEVKKGLLSILPRRDLASDPLDIIFFLVKPEMADPLASLIIEKGHLYFPGRGSVVVEEVTLLGHHEFYDVKDIQPFHINTPPVHLHSCTAICCIVQRGRGNVVARIALDTGTCVPAIYFGTGTGVRNKMGLIRITIPAEKEIVHVFATPHESEIIMEMMIDAGRLDQPGSGFIYSYPVKKGLLNMRVARGERHHAASIEQIVTTLDHIKGSTEWRYRRNIVEKKSARRKSYISNLVDLVILCDGGTGISLVQAAMSAGAGGSTIAGLKLIYSGESLPDEIPPISDECSITIPEELVETVMEALEKAGAYTDRYHGQVHQRKTYTAFTYRVE
jgi:hypothetical protein